MANQKTRKRLFSDMNYREVQRSNSSRKKLLPKKDQKWLKENGYRNVGWDNVIRLYEKINDILSFSDDPNEPTLEDLFLRVDQIGKKYQTPQEIEAFEQALKAEVEDISELVDKQFPEKEIEFADYGNRSHPFAKVKGAGNYKKR